MYVPGSADEMLSNLLKKNMRPKGVAITDFENIVPKY